MREEKLKIIKLMSPATLINWMPVAFFEQTNFNLKNLFSFCEINVLLLTQKFQTCKIYNSLN